MPCCATRPVKGHVIFNLGKRNWRWLLATLLPILLLPVPICCGLEGRGLYILILMSAFWITEAIPLGVTSFLPLVLAPALGIVDSKQIAKHYFQDVMALVIGGIVAAMCVERWNLHKRIALRVLLLFGTSNRWLMLGMMIPSWFLSMWISNTATTAMMVPILVAIIDSLRVAPTESDDQEIDIDMVPLRPGMTELKILPVNGTNARNSDEKIHLNTRKAMLLSVAYAATCGGIGTLIGTGPNMLLKEIVDRLYDDRTGVTFGRWMLFAVPLSVLCLISTWIWLNLHFFGFKSFFSCRSPHDPRITAILRQELVQLGPVRFPEGASLVLFVILVLMWLTRDAEFFPGWKYLMPNESYVRDGTSAMFIALLMFIIPAKLGSFRDGTDYQPLLEWKYVAEKFPWHILFLLGGGLALADVCKSSGINTVLVGHLSNVHGIPDMFLVPFICLLVCCLTEVTSNTAIANIILPIMVDLAVELGKHPLYFMLPVTITCSFAFMLPSATPPNAVVFSAGNITVIDMIKAGSALNIICLLLLLGALNTWGVVIFDLRTFPVWLNHTTNGTTMMPT